MNEIELARMADRLEAFAADKGLIRYITTVVTATEALILNKELERRGTELCVLPITSFKLNFKADPE